MHRDRVRQIVAIAVASAWLASSPVAVMGQDPTAEPTTGARVCGEFRLPDSEGHAAHELPSGTLEIIGDRLSRLGVVAPTLRVDDGTDTIVVELATAEGLDGLDELEWVITSPGVIEFLPVPPSAQGMVEAGPLPETMAEVEPLFSGDAVAGAGVARDASMQETVLDLELTSEAARILDEYAERHFGEQLAIVVDGDVLTAPVIMTTSFEGRAQISAGGDGSEGRGVEGLAAIVGSGPLPVRLETVAFDLCDGAVASPSTAPSPPPQ